MIGFVCSLNSQFEYLWYYSIANNHFCLNIELLDLAGGGTAATHQGGMEYALSTLLVYNNSFILWGIVPYYSTKNKP